MSTQYLNEIPFSANHTQQAFKLLELPPELLSLLESDTPPTLTITPSPLPPHHAHLTLTLTSPLPNNPPKTYLLRQKNTSNPLMLLSPSTTTTHPPNQASSPPIPRASITRISSIQQTIELHPTPPNDAHHSDKENAPKPRPGPEVQGTKVNKWHEKFAQGRSRRSA